MCCGLGNRNGTAAIELAIIAPAFFLAAVCEPRNRLHLLRQHGARERHSGSCTPYWYETGAAERHESSPIPFLPFDKVDILLFCDADRLYVDVRSYSCFGAPDSKASSTTTVILQRLKCLRHRKVERQVPGRRTSSSFTHSTNGRSIHRISRSIMRTYRTIRVAGWCPPASRSAMSLLRSGPFDLWLDNYVGRILPAPAPRLADHAPIGKNRQAAINPAAFSGVPIPPVRRKRPAHHRARRSRRC